MKSHIARSVTGIFVIAFLVFLLTSCPQNELFNSDVKVVISCLGTGSTEPSGTIKKKAGDSIDIAAIVKDCYPFVKWDVSGGADIANPAAVATKVKLNGGDVSIVANFGEPSNTFSITAGANGGGTISPAGVTSVVCGESQAYTITPDECHRIRNVLVNGESKGPNTEYQFIKVQGNQTISAEFEKLTNPISASAGTGGTIFPAGSVSVGCGDQAMFTITPADCYAISNVMVDGSSQGAVQAYTITNVRESHSINATFARKSFVVETAAGSGGTISVSGGSTVNCGDSRTVTITPSDCYSTTNVVIDGKTMGAIKTYTFANIRENHTVSATFSQLSYTIAATAGAGGAINPAGATNYTCGANATYSIVPSLGYTISGVTVDGSSKGAISSYTFDNIRAHHSITASFASTVAKLTLKINIVGECDKPTVSAWVTVNGTQYSAAQQEISFTANQVLTLQADSSGICKMTGLQPLSIGEKILNQPEGTPLPDITPTPTSTPGIINYNYVFHGWSGGISSTASSVNLTMNGDKTVTALFYLESDF